MDLAPEARFGTEIALSGDWALVSAPAAGEGAGAVYAFRYEASTDQWEPRGRVGAELAQPGSGMGSALILHEGQALIGAPGFLNIGAVVSFGLDEAGEAFGLNTLLLPFQATPGAGFGSDLSFADGELLVGAPGAGPQSERHLDLRQQLRGPGALRR